MKKNLLILLIFLFIFMGCSGKSLMHEIPMAEFQRFEYHRAGNFSSLHISATNAQMTEEEIIIDSVSLQADYGPFVNFNIILEGYKRKRVKTIE